MVLGVSVCHFGALIPCFGLISMPILEPPEPVLAQCSYTDTDTDTDMQDDDDDVVVVCRCREEPLSL